MIHVPARTNRVCRLGARGESLVVREADGPSYLSEDFSFCHRARQVGHRIMADTRVRLGHIGSYVYTVEDAGRERVIHPSFRFRVARGG